MQPEKNGILFNNIKTVFAQKLINEKWEKESYEKNGILFNNYATKWQPEKNGTPKQEFYS